MDQGSILVLYRSIPGVLRTPLLYSASLILLFAIGMALPTISLFGSLTHYLPVHILLEGISIIVSLMVFITSWQLRHDSEAGHLPMLGGAFLAVALIDAMHTLSYAGMPAFVTPNSAEKAIDFWLAGRFIAIASLLTLALLPSKLHGKKGTHAWESMLAGALTSFLVFYAVIYHQKELPQTFIASEGLTPFKVYSEYLLVAIGLAAVVAFSRHAVKEHNATLAWLATASLAFALSELFFTLYASVTDLMNLLGHAFKAMGCFAIYIAFFSREGHKPWWDISSRIRLFLAILIGTFISEYLVMMVLPFLLPKDGHAVFEATIDATAMAIIATTFVMVMVNRFQARAMRAEYALDHTHDGYCVIDEQGYLTDANASFCRMFGYRRRTVLNFDIFAFEAPDLPADNRIDIASIIKNGFSNHLTRFRDRDGNLIDLDISATHLPAVRSIVIFLQDITTLKHFEQQIDNLAFYDQLTHLPNRQLLMEKLDRTMIASEETGQYGALLAINLRNFKQLNHARGSDIGDEFLVTTAKRLIDSVGKHGLVAHLGGDEFVVILKNLGQTADKTLNHSQTMGESLRDDIARPVRLGGTDQIAYQGAACIGITLFLGCKEQPEVLLRQATIAMHESKETQQNCIRFYSGEMQAMASERIELTDALRRAIANEQLELHYQPQVRRDGIIIGAEALLRWQHPKFGFVSPAQFIPLAEETGLIIPIGQWVLQQACRQLQQWQNVIGQADFSLSVNVSAVQFRDQNFVEQVQNAMSQSGITPERLKLELTESMLVENVDQTIRRMKEINGFGIGFSLDDFGTGYSSLSYLTKLPLAQLKIDQSFVRNLDSNPNHIAVVRTIINMGQALNLHIIAEGVETEAELEMLERNDCHYYQGYLFGKPLPAERFTQLLTQGQTEWPPQSS